MKTSSSETVTVPPTAQKIERQHTLKQEHKDALERAVSLNVPHAVNAAGDEEVPENEEAAIEVPENEEGQASKSARIGASSRSSGGRLNWDEVVEQLFQKNESGDLRLKKDTNVVAK